MTDFLGTVAQGNCFYPAAWVSAALLLVFLKKRKIGFVLPSLLMLVIIANPLFRDLWENRLRQSYYWRLLWITPVIPLCAAVPAMLSEKLRNPNVKGLAAIACCGIFVLCGSYMYNQKWCEFVVPSPSTSKLPSRVEETAEYLLKQKEHPRIIADLPISTYIRQYTGDVETLYGRDIDGYILAPDPEAAKICKEISKPDGDMGKVAEFMLNNGFDYLVTDDEEDQRKQQLAEHGFTLQHHISVFGIYTVEGKPTQRKERNELGQVISVTWLDENGNPAKGPDRYACALYEYDSNGNITREFHTDTNGKGAADRKGQAGYERAYDNRGNIIMERFLGADGEPLTNGQGYAEVRREYNGNNVTRESYYDAEGRPASRSDTLYASCMTAYNRSGQAILEQYFDTQGRPAASSGGYASVSRKYKGKKITEEAYFGTDGQPVATAQGYCSFRRTYDTDGRLVSESYYDGEGSPANCLNGYAREENRYDGQGNNTCQQFFDEKDVPVVINTGYAEIRRTYNEDGKLTGEEYIGADGKPVRQAAGHTGIEQWYEEEGNLAGRIYLNADGMPVTRTDGYSEVRMTAGTGDLPETISFFDAAGSEIPAEHLNLVGDVRSGPDGWSVWYTPGFNTTNNKIKLGSVNPGNMQAGDTYTCQIEIEFRGVTATAEKEFRMLAQEGKGGLWYDDGAWGQCLTNLDEVPADGIYRFTAAGTVSETRANGGEFAIGFRCDYWAGGSFRVRNVKIEQGDEATDWSPGI